MYDYNAGFGCRRWAGRVRPAAGDGATYNAAANSYFNGLMLLALTAAVGVGMTLIVRGGKKSLDAP